MMMKMLKLIYDMQYYSNNIRNESWTSIYCILMNNECQEVCCFIKDE